jgi:cellulose synthase/poly-beta-1,6-N-acetylglucosamine synthase-like glycosyltransferase
MSQTQGPPAVTPHSAAQVSIIVPTLSGMRADLAESIAAQDLPPTEVQVVVGVRPNGRARNTGVARTHGDVLVFVDDDAVLGDETVVRRLVAPLRDPAIGVTGASKLIPPLSSAFQRWVAREVARIEHPVVSEPLITMPRPENGYYCEVTTTCCAMRRAVFEEVGGFSDTLVQGVDTEFFVHVARRGYQIVLVPHAWVWHPAPASFPALLRKQFRYGLGHAQEVKRDPARGWPLDSAWRRLAYLAFRTVILIPNVFLPYSHAYRHWRPGFKPLKALASYVSALGYVYGWRSFADLSAPLSAPQEAGQEAGKHERPSLNR